MPEFMDVHRNMKGITPEDLLKAHQADLDVQDQENADFKQAWGDPETGLSVGFVTNGFVDPTRMETRGRTISTLAAECLS